MSRTAKTLPPDNYALICHRLDEDGLPVLPRVIRRKPRPGDIHPLSPEDVRNVLLCAPAAYIYGLRGVELRARQGEIGEPYGVYLRDERRIRLYSCPPRIWGFTAQAWPNHKGVLSRGARRVADQGDTGRVLIEWNNPGELWVVYIRILFHELGHHYVNQYRSSRGRPGTRRRNERLADLHDRKIYTNLIRRIDKRRSGA